MRLKNRIMFKNSYVSSSMFWDGWTPSLHRRAALNFLGWLEAMTHTRSRAIIWADAVGGEMGPTQFSVDRFLWHRNNGSSPEFKKWVRKYCQKSPSYQNPNSNHRVRFTFIDNTKWARNSLRRILTSGNAAASQSWPTIQRLRLSHNRYRTESQLDSVGLNIESFPYCCGASLLNGVLNRQSQVDLIHDILNNETRVLVDLFESGYTRREDWYYLTTAMWVVETVPEMEHVIKNDLSGNVYRVGKLYFAVLPWVSNLEVNSEETVDTIWGD